MSTAGDTRGTDEAPRVVAGVDDSGSARAALGWAVGWARHTGARVLAVTAWAPHLPVVTGPEVGAATVAARVLTDEQLQSQARQWLDDAIAALPDGAEQILDREVVRGDVATVLLDAARSAELLVVGNTRRGALISAITGSLAQQCVHHARCPVVLVPDPDDRADL
jgi:nucleotide-binding universal stress UspA family protein